MPTEIRNDGSVWCPKCEDYVRLLSVRWAAKLVSVSPKTIYRYIEEGDVYVINVAGHTYRICGTCLIRPVDDDISIENEKKCLKS